jgi:hypothetical protein
MRAHSRWLTLAVLVALGLPAGLQAQDEPPPWEAGDDGPSWETGDVPLPPEEDIPPPPEEEAPQELIIDPPGVDRERFQPRTETMEAIPVDELGVEIREVGDHRWTVVPFDARGPVVYGAAGFEAGGGLGHMVFTVAGGYTVAGHWRALRADGERPRLEGTATNVMLSMDLAPGVTNDALASFVTIGVRGQQIFAFGEHLMSMQFTLGGRKDLGTDLGGVDLAFGLGYAFNRAPVAIPVQLELVRHFAGVFGREWGARITVGWPFSFWR